jgi:glycosyltransferase involved in cell wall biosynthesis
VSIVVPAFNEEKLIGQTLDHLGKAGRVFQEDGWRSELIVCDNNSTDRTAEIARQSGAKVVFEPINQISRARNCGARAATGQWLLFVDADTQPSTELLAETRSMMDSGRCLGGGSVVQMQDSPLRGRLAVGAWNRLSRLSRWMAGSYIFCQRAAFERLGGFSERLFVAEEIEFSRRLKRLARLEGKRVVILRRHPLVTSPRKLHLYSGLEFWRFLVKMVLSGGGIYRNRDECHIWYDGRR